ncbi:hypothetical protein FOL47_007276 [Perkinsus chesapeaki]|uniref:Potassium channel domain-containing protein n=1 Tax=Perkinsus chesapeaki TaxID=330153 RepID=A0A7J6LLM4_PERCH|nr:hypothetical protein FOL47_007276 [Perkinsus chesapeaki]
MICPLVTESPYVALDGSSAASPGGGLESSNYIPQHPTTEERNSSLRSLKDEETPWEEWKHSIICISFYTGAGLLYCLCWAGWSLVDSTYFLIVTGSTVGYGDMSFPLDTTSSIFACCYLILGVGIAAYSAGLVLNKWVQTTETEMAKAVQQSHLKRSEQSLLQNRVLRKHVLRSLARLAVTLCVGAGVIGFLEGWGGPKALYWCVQTVTTVGYGNLQLTSSASKVFTIFFIPIGVAVGASTMSSLASIPLIKQRAKAERRVLHQFGNELDPKAFDQLSKAFKELKRLGLCQSSRFITRNEFLIWMLLQLQRIDEKDLKYCGKVAVGKQGPCCGVCIPGATFDMMDANCDGRLDYRDIQEVRRNAIQQGKRRSTRVVIPESGAISPQLALVTPSHGPPNTPSSATYSSSEDARGRPAVEAFDGKGGAVVTREPAEEEHQDGELYSKASNVTTSSSPRNGGSFPVGRETTLDCVTRDLVPILMKSHTMMLSRTCDKSARFVRSGTMADNDSDITEDTDSDDEPSPPPSVQAQRVSVARLSVPENEVVIPVEAVTERDGRRQTPNRGRPPCRRSFRSSTVHFAKYPKGDDSPPDCNVSGCSMMPQLSTSSSANLLSRTVAPQTLGSMFSCGTGGLLAAAAAPGFTFQNNMIPCQVALSQNEVSEAIGKLQGWWISGSGSGTHYFVANDGNIHCYKQEKSFSDDAASSGSKRLVRQERCIHLRVCRGQDGRAQVWAGPLKFEKSDGGTVLWSGSNNDHGGPRQFTWQRIRSPEEQSPAILRAPSPMPSSPSPATISQTPAIKRHAEDCREVVRRPTPQRRQSCSPSQLRRRQQQQSDGVHCRRLSSVEVIPSATLVEKNLKRTPSRGSSTDSMQGSMGAYPAALSTAQSTPHISKAEGMPSGSMRALPGALDMDVIEEGLKTRRNSVPNTLPTVAALEKHPTVDLPQESLTSATELLSTRTDPGKGECLLPACNCAAVREEMMEKIEAFMSEMKEELKEQRELIHTIKRESKEAIDALEAEFKQSQLDPAGLTRLLDDLDNREADVQDVTKTTRGLQSQVLALGQDVRTLRADIGRLRDRLLVSNADLRLERVASIGPLSDISSSRLSSTDGTLTPPHASSDTIRIDRLESRSEGDVSYGRDDFQSYPEPCEHRSRGVLNCPALPRPGSVTETIEWDSDIESAGDG